MRQNFLQSFVLCNFNEIILYIKVHDIQRLFLIVEVREIQSDLKRQKSQVHELYRQVEQSLLHETIWKELNDSFVVNYLEENRLVITFSH